MTYPSSGPAVACCRHHGSWTSEPDPRRGGGFLFFVLPRGVDPGWVVGDRAWFLSLNPPCLPRGPIVLFLAGDFSTSRNKQETPVFLPLSMRADLGDFYGPKLYMADFFPTVGHFFFGRKSPNSQKEISVVNSDFFFCQTKKCPAVGKKVRHVWFQVHQKSDRPRAKGGAFL